MRKTRVFIDFHLHVASMFVCIIYMYAYTCIYIYLYLPLADYMKILLSSIFYLYTILIVQNVILCRLHIKVNLFPLMILAKLKRGYS